MLIFICFYFFFFYSFLIFSLHYVFLILISPLATPPLVSVVYFILVPLIPMMRLWQPFTIYLPGHLHLPFLIPFSANCLMGHDAIPFLESSADNTFLGHRPPGVPQLEPVLRRQAGPLTLRSCHRSSRLL